MYVEKLRVLDFKCFDHAEASFVHPKSVLAPAPFATFNNVNVLLGNNGAGKTSILRAVALGALAPVLQASGFRPVGYVRRAGAVMPGNVAMIELNGVVDENWITLDKPLNCHIVARGSQEVLTPVSGYEAVQENLFNDEWSGFFVLGYGATRRVEAQESYDPVARLKSRGRRFVRVGSLFEEHFSIPPLGAWFREAPKEVRLAVSELVDELVPGSTRLLPELHDGDVAFEHRGTRLGFHQLSDGYRSYLGWLTDLLGECSRFVGPKLASAQGIVLIDEVDLHLHPRWQRCVLPLLAKHLPNLQFIVTTHSPIVAGTVSSQNLWVIDWPEDVPAPLLRRPTEEVWGLSAEQILTSPAFGLATTRNEAMVEQLREAETRGDSRRFTRLVSLGGAGLDAPPPGEVPEWVQSAAQAFATTQPASRAKPKSATKKVAPRRATKAAAKKPPAKKPPVKKPPVKKPSARTPSR